MAQDAQPTETEFDYDGPLPERLVGLDSMSPVEALRAKGVWPYIDGWYPEDYRAPRDLPRGYRPGERMLHGKPINFDLDLMIAYRADLRVEAEAERIDAGADLTTWSYDRLHWLTGALATRANHRRRKHSSDPLGERIAKVVWAEFGNRPEYLRVFNPSRLPKEAA